MTKRPFDVDAPTLSSEPPVTGDSPTLVDSAPSPQDQTLRDEISTSGDAATMVQEAPLSYQPTLPTAPLYSAATPVKLREVTLDDHDGKDRYETRKVLGAGGMGEVRLCRDRRLGREVAFKSMHPELTRSTSASARFLREARIQGQLEHPSVVPVYDLDTLPDGSVFFTMKRVRGVTLEHVLDELRQGAPGTVARFTQRRLLTAFSSVCLAVDYAHARGVLHRDLKPGNVMLGDFGEVNVLDWGIAKTVSSAGEPEEDATEPLQVDEMAGQTVHGSLLGTPGYMAPEQARGEIARLDARADVYALGAILFEILTLHKMNDGSTTRELLLQTLAGGGPARLGRSSKTDVPPELETIYLAATELDLEARTSSARALSDAIERFLDGDRDLQLRREMGAAHAERAADAAARAGLAGSAGQDARVLALREVGRALALDASHAGALRTLTALLTAPPAETPPEAEAEMALVQARASREAAKLAAIRIGIWLAFGVAILWNARNLFAVVATAVTAGAGACAWWSSKQERPRRRFALAFLILISLATAMLSGVFGPLFLIPSLAATNTMFFALNADRRHRLLVVLFGLGSILVPVVIDAFGWSAAPYTVVDAGILIHARFMDIGRGSLLMLLAMNLSIIVTTAFMVSRVRDALSAAERHLFLQAWQLRQLVPQEAHDSVRHAPRDANAAAVPS